MRDYKKYDVWKLSHQMTLEVYRITESFPKAGTFGLSSQLRRAASSIGLNIAEGCGRGSDEDFKRMLVIANGSAFETEYALLLCKDLKFLSLNEFENISPLIEELKMKISKLILKLQADIEARKKSGVGLK